LPTDPQTCATWTARTTGKCTGISSLRTLMPRCVRRWGKAMSEPVAWQWLNTAHFRKNVPAGAEVEVWRPLYAHPAPSAEPCPHIRSSGTGEWATNWCSLNGPPDHRVMDKPPEVKREPLPEHPLDIGPRVWMTREAYRRDQEELASLREYARSTRDKLAEFRTMRENEWQIRRSVALSAGLNTEGPDDWGG
jgi:hypothetical protein